MLQDLSEEVRICLWKAENCARQAKAAPNEALRADYLFREQNWLKLARSYELQQRITLFINTKSKHKNNGDRGVDANDRADRAARDLITIVDDDKSVRDSMSALIKAQGYRAAMFASAEAFLASDVKKHTTCLILDVHLPGMHGSDLQAHLIANGGCPPTVFVTGRFEEHVKEQVIEAGALGYLSKPFTANALFDCIEKAFGAPNHY